MRSQKSIIFCEHAEYRINRTNQKVTKTVASAFTEQLVPVSSGTENHVDGTGLPCSIKQVESGDIMNRTQDSQSRETGFETFCCRFNTWTCVSRMTQNRLHWLIYYLVFFPCRFFVSMRCRSATYWQHMLPFTGTSSAQPRHGGVSTKVPFESFVLSVSRWVFCPLYGNVIFLCFLR